MKADYAKKGKGMTGRWVQKKRFAWAFSLVLLAALDVRGAEQVVPIGSLRTPQRIGETFLIEGVVIDEPDSRPRNAFRAYLQDDSGGIRVVSRNPDALANSRMGDRLQVRGKLVSDSGRAVLEVELANAIGEGTVPLPKNVTAASAIAPKNIGRLVRITGVVELSPRFTTTGEGLTVRDSSGTIRVPLQERYIRNVEFMRGLTSGSGVTVVGIPERINIRNQTSYRLRLRELADLQVMAAPPYFEIGAVASAILMSALFVFLVSRRRQAEAHAAELCLVLENLRTSQDNLASSETRLRALVENTNDIVWEADRNLCYTYCSPNVASILGYTAEEVSGRSLCDYALPEECPKIREAFYRARKTGSFSLLEYIAVTKDGRRLTLESGGRVVTDSEGNITGYRGVNRDITVRRRLEAQVRQGQKMEAVGRLAGGIAHDFNNTLTVISACTSLLEERGDADVRRYACNINKAVERSAGMTRHLLAFSRKQVLQARTVDLNQQLKDLTSMLRCVISEDIELEMDLAEGLWSIKGDPSQIEQVVMNLLVNARDAMPQGGTIRLQTSNATINTGDEVPGAPAALVGDYVILMVSDTGHGIDPAILPQIFDPFFTTKGVGKGTGLGLATVYGIVTQSGGFISVESNPGSGTSFRILLPQATNPAHSNTKTAETVQNVKGTVLLVEDEDPVRGMVTEVLRNHGYHVLAALGREDALAICRDFAGKIDLLLSDVVLPKASGPSIAAELTAMRPTLKVLFMSGYTDDRIGSNGLLEPDVNLIHKPFTPEDLEQIISNTLRGSGLGRSSAFAPC